MCLLCAGVALARAAPQEPPPSFDVRAEAPEQEPVEVKEVELRLPPGSAASDTRGLPELVAVRRGQLLSTLAVRRSVEALWNTGRFTHVEARAVEVEGGVRLVFLLTPVQKLVRLVIEGNVALSDEEIREASGLPEDAPLDPDSVDRARAAVEQAYHRKGYDQAHLNVSEEPSPTGGVVLVFTMDEGQPTRVGRVTLTGSPGLPLASLLDTLALRPGVVLDQARLDAGLEKLRTSLRQQRYYRARVGAPTVTVDQGLATVAVPVSAGPRYTLHFHGNHQFPSVVLERILAYDGSEVLDPGVMWNLARRLTVFYQYRGFSDVRVTPREVRKPDHAEAVLAFEIEEGLPLTVTEVRFQGNRALPSGVLREVLAEIIRTRDPAPELQTPLRDDPLALDGRGGQGPRSVPLAPDPHRVFVEEAYLGAAEVLTDAYRERGFPQAQVRFHRLDVDVNARTAVAEFQVEEGSENRVDEVLVEGLPEGTGPEELGLRPGDSLSEEAVERARQNLEQAVARQGYLFARVGVTATPTQEDPRYVKVFLRVEPGPQVRVGRIIFQGLTRTDERTVRALLKLEVGKPLELEKLAEGRRRLARLNIFRQLEVQLREPNRREEIKDILVTVQERPRIDGEVSGGYFLVDGPRVTLDTAFPNVDGRGLNLLARAKVNYVGWSQEAFSGRYAGAQDDTIRGWEGLGGRGNVALTQPNLNFFLLPRDTGARVDLIGERVHRPSYLSTRFAAVGGLDWPAKRWLNLALQGELEHNRLRSRSGVLNVLSRADQERLRFPYGVFTLYSLRGSTTLDFRDEPTNPRKGLLVSGSAEFTRDISAAPTDALGNKVADFPIHELKLSGSVSVYAPLGRRASFALSARAGTILPLSENAQSIGSKLFYLGGSSSLRGFREDGVLPEDQRAEVRQQLLACRGIITSQGCPSELVAVLSGQAPLSQGGELFTLGKAELRLPAFNSLDLGVFFEAGNLWGDRTNFEPTVLRYTAGGGVRYVTPVGPLAFDIGFNLDPDEDFNEPATQFHFSIGVF